MQFDASLSNAELLARMPVLVLCERSATAEVVEHLMEIDRRKLYLSEACSSLSAYCRERLGYSEDAAGKRVRVARLALEVPQVLDELRSGRIHASGLILLAPHLTRENADELLGEAKCRSRREIERLLAARFPRADVETSVTPLGTPASMYRERNPTDGAARERLEPLSAASYLVQFTASNELYVKLQHARELLSHSNPAGELAPILERALDELIRCEEKRRMGAGAPRKQRQLKDGSRHVPLEVARVVWKRDGARCTFVDDKGRRCSERRFITIEHRIPHARGGRAEPQNLCLLCSSHNAYTAELAFGADHIARKRREARHRATRRPTKWRASQPPGIEQVPSCAETCRHKQTPSSQRTSNSGQGAAEVGANRNTRLLSALCWLGFPRREAAQALELTVGNGEQDDSALLRAALGHLTPDNIQRSHK
ncbi:MAG: HNH endonuclease [Myxococcota bacterium]